MKRTIRWNVRGRALTAVLFFCIVRCAMPSARADEGPTVTGPLSPQELQFVAAVRTDLLRRYPRVTDAESAGFVRYTEVDDTGAISYANRKWASDPQHPSQLWYDASGTLMGADFSVLRPHNEPRPALWGVNPGRWYEFNGHVHYVVTDPNSGKTFYNKWVWNDDFSAAGGNLANPAASTLVNLGQVPSASAVRTIFEMPTIWDLVVWVRPHSEGVLHW
jgi:hypothetical protein